MTSVNAYLTFDGNAEEALNFYQSVFGGEFVNFSRFKGMPGCENMPEADQNRLMHVTLPIGNTMLMASDSMPSMGKVKMGDNFSIAIAVDSEAEADRVFNGLSAGGTVTMPLAKTFWNAYFGMFTDKFGIQWMVNYDYPKQ